jgi:hypothetical protein
MLSKLASCVLLFLLTIAVLIAGVVFIQSASVFHGGKSSLLPPSITATDAVVVIVGNAEGNADPGEILEYAVTINSVAENRFQSIFASIEA